MRCIETWFRRKNKISNRDKLQHEMYWNTIKIPEPETNAVINYNMRCIETQYNT